jgi:hypothetical protein
MKSLTDSDLDLLEKFGGSAASRSIADGDASLIGSRVTDAFGNPPGAEADGQLGQVQKGGARKRHRSTRRLRRHRQRRKRSTRRLRSRVR